MAQHDRDIAGLIEEVAALRREISLLRSGIERLKAEQSGIPTPLKPRSPRKRVQGDIEFIADFDVIEASAIDLSEGGICFEIEDEEMPYEMRFTVDGRERKKRAQLVWVERRDEGGYRLGLEFVPPKPHPEF